MIHKRAINHYCARCRITTAHDESEHDSRCRRCGAVKQHTRCETAVVQATHKQAAEEPAAENTDCGWN